MIARQNTASPFDSIAMLADGGERWSARDLMPLLDYERWERFEDAIDRARTSATTVGHDVENHFRGAAKKVPLGSGAERNVTDFHLTRFACYLVAMNSDVRKPAVAAAQSYFAVRTREAETAASPRAELSNRDLALMVLAEADRADAEAAGRQVAEQKVAELEPGAEAHDAFMRADGLLTMEAAAKALGYGRNILFKDLRRLGVIQANRLPYQRYAHHFEVKAGTYTNRVTGELVPTATTYVRPAGLDFLRRKLTNAVEAIEMAGTNA